MDRSQSNVTARALEVIDRTVTGLVVAENDEPRFLVDDLVDGIQVPCFRFSWLTLLGWLLGALARKRVDVVRVVVGDPRGSTDVDFARKTVSHRLLLLRTVSVSGRLAITRTKHQSESPMPLPV